MKMNNEMINFFLLLNKIITYDETKEDITGYLRFYYIEYLNAITN